MSQAFSFGKFSTGTKYLETSCIGKCPHRYRIDEHHPEYARVLTGLERGDRSVVYCYHKPAPLP